MIGPHSIRGKVSLAATAISAVAMIAIIAITAFATQYVLKQNVVDTLNRHIDIVQVEVSAGRTNLSIEGTGSELIQVIGPDGTVVASSNWAEGVSAISQGDLAAGQSLQTEVDQMVLERVPVNFGDDVVVIGPAANAEDAASGDGSGSNAGAGTGSSSGGHGYGSGHGSGHKTPISVAPDDDDDDDHDDDSGDDRDDDGDDDGDDRDDDRDDDSDDDDRNDYGNHAGHRSGNSDDDSDGNDEKARMQQSGASAFSIKSLFGPQIAFATPVESAASSQNSVSATALLGQKGPFVVVERGVVTPEGTMTIAAMASVEGAAGAAGLIARLLAVVALISVVAVAVLSWRLAARTLHPVDEMRTQVDAISAGDLSARIPVPESDQDLSKLAVTFNKMLARVEAAMNEQRRFISDASHELKSPVAATRIMLDTAAAHPEAIDVDRLTSDLRGENERMGGIVGNLLLLAQQDEGKPRIEKTPIDLCDVIYEEVAALRSRTPLQVDLSGVAPVVCRADATAMRHALRNLLDNAARYGKSLIKVTCFEEGGHVYVRISDDGPGIPEADRERVFGRFVRLEEGRSRKEGSTGLGLAVVMTVAQQHGGTARFCEPELGGATAELIFDAE